MQFIITALDGTDSEAPARRAAVRDAHLAGVQRQKAAGKHLFAAALLDDEGRMIGSVMIVEYPSKEALAAEWLDNEPYVTASVWQKIDVQPCKVPAFFLEARGE